MKKYLNMIMLAIIFLFLSYLSSCNTYNAKLYDFAIEWINDETRNEYKTIQEKFVDGIDYSYPLEPFKYTFIVTNEEEYSKIFKQGIDELIINYDKKMIIVYTFNSVYTSTMELKKIDYQNSSLVIEYKYDLIPGTGSACEPYQRWLVLVMNKIEVTEITFTQRRR